MPRFPFSYGVFQEYYLSHGPFRSNPSGLAAISTTAIAIMFFASPFVALGIQRFPRARRTAGLVGIAIINLALISGSFCNSSAMLLLTQGILYGLGGVILYFPAMYLIDEWFIARKGLAISVVMAGTGAAGTVIPFLLQWLLNKYGFRIALRVWSAIAVCLADPRTQRVVAADWHR